MSTVPTNAYALALFPGGNGRSQFINNTCDLVPGHARILEARPLTLFGKGIAMADSAGLHANPDVAGRRRGDLALDKLEFGSGRSNLDSFHFWHADLLR